MIEPVGFLTQHMIVHLGLMGIVAPAAASIAVRRTGGRMPGQAHLAAATAVQFGLLWAWHAPWVLTRAHESALAILAMHSSLIIAALWFWGAILSARAHAPWKSIVALLVTGKLVCLLGILFTLAPRPIYAVAIHAGHAPSTQSLIADQQMAGLVMLAACPVVYVAMSTLIVRRWMSQVDRSGGWSFSAARQPG